MSGRKLEEKIVSIPEVKEIMKNVKDQITEIDSEEEGMTHFQEITFNYVNQFSKMTERDAVKIKKLLQDKYEIEEIFAINIVNIDPKTLQELRMILEKSFAGKALKDDKLEEMLYQITELKTT